ncbi:hypothetical protein NVIRENTERO_03324 [Sodalis praecaptivus]|nr:hypothetical protein NVIRENTERO_03324 [Sodalis praecaptivus]
MCHRQTLLAVLLHVETRRSPPGWAALFPFMHAAFFSCFRGFLRVIFEAAATAMLPPFFTRFRRFLFIFSKISGTAAMFSHNSLH